ncbi:MAG TPA: SDR family oxidoreductase [Opitutaceae bacterium]
MVIITGAGGTVGSHVIKELQSTKTPFRAAYFSESKVKAARAHGIDAVTIDYSRPETLSAALKGSDRLFLLGPNALHQTELELNAVEAAKSAGIKHIVKLSVWRADEESYSFAKIHRPVEKAIEASGMAWTFVRPNGFMQNVVTYMGESIKAEGAFYSAVGEAKMSHVDVRDIAAVVVKALTETGHDKKAYTLSGPEALSYSEMAQVLSTVLGRPIRHVSLPPAELKSGMLATGINETYADRLLDLDRYYREGQASRITSDIKHVTGRDPIRFEQYARDHASSLRSAP